MPAPQQSSYRKYGRTSGGFLAERKLYYDDLVLLAVETGLTHERYRKVAWADICGFSITYGATWLVVALLAGLPMAILLLISVVNGFRYPGVWIAAIACGIVFAINLARGRSVKCVITTAYSKVPVRSITRLRKARAFQEFLRDIESGLSGEWRAAAARQKSGPARR